MAFIDIVYCYVEVVTDFNSNIDKLILSFVENGFKVKKLNPNKWKLKRGAGFALEFNYDSESIQMQVFLDNSKDGKLKIKVGNWGFPFEPLFMKKRFVKNIERFQKEIKENGVLLVNSNEVSNISVDAKKKKLSAVKVLAIVLIIPLYKLLVVLFKKWF